jgi:hypothetical protein
VGSPDIVTIQISTTSGFNMAGRYLAPGSWNSLACCRFG